MANERNVSKFFTAKEAAEYLRVNLNSFYKWAREDGGPPIRKLHKACIRVPKEEFFKWVESRKES